MRKQVLLSRGAGLARSCAARGRPRVGRAQCFGESRVQHREQRSPQTPPNPLPFTTWRPSSFSSRSPPPPPAVCGWAVTAPPPTPSRAAPARLHALLSKGAAGPRSPGFRTWAGRAGGESGQRRTDLCTGKLVFGNVFAVWPWASHSPSLGSTFSPFRKRDCIPNCPGIPEVSITPFCSPKTPRAFVPVPARI